MGEECLLFQLVAVYVINNLRVINIDNEGNEREVGGFESELLVGIELGDVELGNGLLNTL